MPTARGQSLGRCWGLGRRAHSAWFHSVDGLEPVRQSSKLCPWLPVVADEPLYAAGPISEHPAYTMISRTGWWWMSYSRKIRKERRAYNFDFAKQTGREAEICCGVSLLSLIRHQFHPKSLWESRKSSVAVGELSHPFKLLPVLRPEGLLPCLYAKKRMKLVPRQVQLRYNGNLNTN